MKRKNRKQKQNAKTEHKNRTQKKELPENRRCIKAEKAAILRESPCGNESVQRAGGM